MNSRDKKGQVAVITGATKGLGRALSLAFAMADYEVIGVYRSDSVNAARIESEFQVMGLRGQFIRQDVVEDGRWAEFDEAINANRNKDVTLIANASIPFIPKPFHLNEWADYAAQLEVNVKGTLNTFRRLLPEMIRQRCGTLISVLSSALDTSPKGFAAYLTAKSALKGLVEAAAAEYSGRGIRVFSVSPGFMKTPLTDNWSNHLKAQFGSVGQCPDAIANRILALAMDPSTGSRGETYCLDEQVHLAGRPAPYSYV